MVASPPVSGLSSLVALASGGEQTSPTSSASSNSGETGEELVTLFRASLGQLYFGLPAGAQAPAIRLPLLGGGEVASDDLRGHPLLLLFVDPECEACDEVLPELSGYLGLGRQARMLVVSRGDAAANLEWLERLGIDCPIAMQKGWETSRDYRILAAPAAYLIDENGAIRAGPAVGAEKIRQLARSSVDHPPGGRSGMAPDSVAV
jgi:hypothetical protein